MIYDTATYLDEIRISFRIHNRIFVFLMFFLLATLAPPPLVLSQVTGVWVCPSRVPVKWTLTVRTWRTAHVKSPTVQLNLETTSSTSSLLTNTFQVRSVLLRTEVDSDFLKTNGSTVKHLFNFRLFTCHFWSN